MPIVSVTTTAGDVFFGSNNLASLSLKNGSATGTDIIYIRNKNENLAEVSSTNYEHSLTAGDSIGFDEKDLRDGISIRAISNNAGGVTLEILPTYKKQTKGY